MNHPLLGTIPVEALADQLQRRWKTTPGQVWEIESLTVPGAQHRIMCGDSTNERHRNILTFNQRCDVLFGDPPYGINLLKAARKFGKSKTLYKPIIGDDHPFDPRPFLQLADTSLLWGANHYASMLPNSPFWLVWDKHGTAKPLSFAAGELAWSNHRQQVRILRHIWSGFRRDSEVGKQRYHPTQKPVAVLVWALQWLPGTTILELWLGSGSTLLACEELGRTCYGMEIDPAYIAVTLQRACEAGMKVKLVDKIFIQ